MARLSKNPLLLLRSLAINAGLLLVAVIGTLLISPFGILFTLIQAAREGNSTKALTYLSRSLWSAALGLDILGATLNRDLLNATCIRSGGYGFGQNNETISKALGINKKQKTLTRYGRWFADALNKIDKDHVEKATL